MIKENLQLGKTKTLADRTRTALVEKERKNDLLSMLKSLPYDLFNGDGEVIAYFSKNGDLMIMPNSQFKIIDINLSCTEHFDDQIGQPFYTLNKRGLENVKIYTEFVGEDLIIFGEYRTDLRI